MFRRSTVLGVLLAALTLATAYGAKADGVPAPEIAKARGEACVAETGYMRRNHMRELKHQRDETMHNGIRTKRFSLTQCLDCHAVPDAEKKPVGYDDPKHFCRSCHDFAAVTIDCFNCHNSKPGDKAGPQRWARAHPVWGVKP